MKFCIACSSVASDMILSVLSINSEVPVRLKLELAGPLEWSAVRLYGDSLLSIIRFLFLCRPLAATVTGLGHGMVITPLFCIHLVWYSCLQSIHRCPCVMKASIALWQYTHLSPFANLVPLRNLDVEFLFKLSYVIDTTLNNI